jgi:hypothetical protein
MFGSNMHELSQQFILRNEEIDDLYRTIRISIVTLVKSRSPPFTLPNNTLVGKPEGRRPLGRPRRRWEDNIKMEHGEIRFGDVDWIHLAQDRDRWRAVVNTVMNLRVHKMLGIS